MTLYTKPDCSLCDDARAALGRVRSTQPFELAEVDVSQHPTLAERYGERLPVVAVDGVDAFDYLVDEAGLQRLLAQSPEPAR